MNTVAGRVLAGARTMAGPGIRDLSALSGVSYRTLSILEHRETISFGEYGEPGKHQRETVMRVVDALAKAGVQVSRDGRGAHLIG